ncbi:hypothetical protein SH1V18_01570 [Vallitalea longa]|uniref:Uncharacterized protein n=1 Tax=Vallitalea longa TaxID=2936439 RepID=A0A9W6DDV1_9FIRM|nr:hypothetical protein [Vallitalea longa]GKX27677.1 hypothetical protein SH1V18_01570 [Vallitalea longa]
MSNSFYASKNQIQLKAINQIPHSNKIQGTIISKNLMSIKWETLPDNQAASNGNALYVWQNTGLPWGQGQSPLQYDTIKENSQTGDQVFKFNVEKKPYIVAYSTSASGSSFCATLQFNPGSAEGVPSFTTIELVEPALGDNSLIAKFTTPIGNNPKANNNWIGLWEGAKVTYDGSNRIKKIMVESNVSSDTQLMNNLSLTVDTTYTLGYACGPQDSDLTAFVTFTTSPY